MKTLTFFFSALVNRTGLKFYIRRAHRDMYTPAKFYQDRLSSFRDPAYAFSRFLGDYLQGAGGAGGGTTEHLGRHNSG